MNGIESYQRTAVSTQSRGRLIVMLYDGAIKFMKLAIQEIEAGNWAAKGQYLIRAQDIIAELNAVLDTEAGGEIARNLRRLYLFMNRRLCAGQHQEGSPDDPGSHHPDGRAQPKLEDDHRVAS